MKELTESSKAEELDFHFAGFHTLIPHRVQHVLMVSSLYESFILEEDGLLNELITSEYMDMNLSHAPRVVRASTEAEALEVLQREQIDLVITIPRVGRRPLADFAAKVQRLKPGLPVIALAAEPEELVRHVHQENRGGADRVFVWNGDAKILLTIVKFVEDQLNVEHDTRVGNVRVIILVENSVRFYSAYLPLIYTEVVKLTQSLMAEGINVMHRLLRMRARPKILLAEDFEEAWLLFSKYQDNVLGVISDVRFPRNGKLDNQAGVEFTRRVHDCSPLMPVLLQSSDAGYAEQARELDASFLNKRSPHLLQELRSFILGNLGFGDFIFKLPDGTEVGRANDLQSLEDTIARVPEEALAFHARFNHFSNWLMARTEFEMAACIRPRKISDFANLSDLRSYLLTTLSEFRERERSGLVADFSPKRFDTATTFTRIGGGSLGGKGRGLAFINALIRRHNLRHRFDNVHISVPHSAVLGTDALDTFLDQNQLHTRITQELDDGQIANAFLRAKLPGSVRRNLKAFLNRVRYPLAVRSSSVLEDSLDQPFAGIYATHFIPNNHPDPKVRLNQLCTAVKLVYASAFFRGARHYLEVTGHPAGEEKMGVILQELVGSAHDQYFYPTFSGVARSFNFYPAGQMTPDEGVACVALGLGKMVVEGGQCLMFSPAHPNVLPQFPNTEEMLNNSQRQFYALDLSRAELAPRAHEDVHLAKLELDAAELHGTLAPVGSVYSPENDMVYDGIHRTGPRLVTFAHVLKHDLFPLADILRLLLDVGREALACPVEIEFAVDLSVEPHEFGFLQIRPIVSDEDFEHLEVEAVNPAQAVCLSPKALGNGRIQDLHDVIYVRPESFDAGRTREIAAEIATLNRDLKHAGRSCVLIGPGRWGSADRWLGIPVTWEQISSAKVIVETTLGDFLITSSQGTHFFQNLTSLRVGYLAVNPAAGEGHLDWDWLAAQPACEETLYLRHLRLAEPLVVRLDGRHRYGVIYKPGTTD